MGKQHSTPSVWEWKNQDFSLPPSLAIKQTKMGKAFHQFHAKKTQRESCTIPMDCSSRHLVQARIWS